MHLYTVRRTATRTIDGRSTVSPARLLGLLATSVLAAILTGCAGGSWCCSSPPEDPPIKDVLVYWDDHVHVTSNTQNHTAALPGLAGRIWLQGEEAKQMEEARGKIVIELYDMTGGPNATPKPLVGVTYGRNDLPQFKRKDLVGDGYTLFVPWESYRPDVKEVKLLVYYMPDKGPMKQGNEVTMTLRPAEQPQITGGQRTVPVALATDKK